MCILFATYIFFIAMENNGVEYIVQINANKVLQSKVIKIRKGVITKQKEFKYEQK